MHGAMANATQSIDNIIDPCATAESQIHPYLTPFLLPPCSNPTPLHHTPPSHLTPFTFWPPKLIYHAPERGTFLVPDAHSLPLSFSSCSIDTEFCSAIPRALLCQTTLLVILPIFFRVSMCRCRHVRWFSQRAALKMVSINRRWTPAEMLDLKMSWTATRITIFGRRDVSHGHASERQRAAPHSWNAPDKQGPPEEDGGVAMVNVLIINVPVEDENCWTFTENTCQKCVSHASRLMTS